MHMQVTPRRVVIVLAAGAAVGFSIFGALVYRTVDIEYLDRAEAARRFAAVRAALPPGPPLLAVDEKGNVVRRETPRNTTPAPIRRLSVLRRAVLVLSNQRPRGTVRAAGYRVRP
jgi:hypothetical protein